MKRKELLHLIKLFEAKLKNVANTNIFKSSISRSLCHQATPIYEILVEDLIIEIKYINVFNNFGPVFDIRSTSNPSGPKSELDVTIRKFLNSNRNLIDSIMESYKQGNV